MAQKILVTSALPYANGHIHIGHLVEYLQTDIWVRAQRAQGRRAIYICADDTHGTAIMMRARQEGRSETELIERMSAAHQRDFEGFQIQFDHYGSTHSDANRVLCARIWSALREKGLVSEREVTQLFDPEAGVFLADRFVKGTCPRCQAPDQYGDSCDKCGGTYSPAELTDATSTLSGHTPELRSATHLFVEIEQLHDFLVQWTQEPGHLQPEVANYLKGHFLAEPLRDWDVSRPAPYFGFEIPDAPQQYWYVWFDAPIGYIASTQEWCDKTGEKLDDWWASADTKIHHFIGKDITYFHTLFWPAMLKSAELNLPARVQVHGFLTVNGEKMSKSKGTFILASTYLEHLDPQYLRYYYAAKLGAGVDDLDLSTEELITKVNSDLVGKVVNLASRTARFVKGRRLSKDYPDDGGLFEAAKKRGAEIAEAYDTCDFARAMRLVMSLADRANEYIDRTQPWKLAKDPAREAELVNVCTVALNLYRQMMVYLAPVLPGLAEKSAELLAAPVEQFTHAQAQLLDHQIGEFSHLMTRVDPKKLQAVIDASRDAQKDASMSEATSQSSPTEAHDVEPLADECTIDDFTKVDLRVARVVQAEDVAEAKKLLKLTVDLGPLGQRTVFAGIKAAYSPDQLVGRLVAVVANLAPRKMKFGTSEGMIIAAGAGGASVFVLSPDTGAKPGERLH